jgi:hypothetical protein
VKAQLRITLIVRVNLDHIVNRALR